MYQIQNTIKHLKFSPWVYHILSMEQHGIDEVVTIKN